MYTQMYILTAPPNLHLIQPNPHLAVAIQMYILTVPPSLLPNLLPSPHMGLKEIPAFNLDMKKSAQTVLVYALSQV
jgi:hypothetical protein